MLTKRINIWKQDEYTYPLAMGFQPNLVTYLHEDEAVRPAMIVVPGGGYCVVSPTEGEIVAKKFYEMGYQAFVQTYTTNMLMEAPLGKQPMRDLSRGIRYVRKHAEEFRVRPDQLVICGFSAGGHLCGSVCVHYEDVTESNPEYDGISNRPDAAILSYPVITSGEYAHKDSFKALLGMRVEEQTGETFCSASQEEQDYMSLEKQVTANTPPCFLWQTAEDELVPVENSYLYAEACRREGVPFAHHVFSHGQHGLSLADETWASCAYGEPYTMEQNQAIVEAVKERVIFMSEDARKAILEQEESWRIADSTRKDVNEEAKIWPELAVQWLKGVL